MNTTLCTNRSQARRHLAGKSIISSTTPHAGGTIPPGGASRECAASKSSRGFVAFSLNAATLEREAPFRRYTEAQTSWGRWRLNRRVQALRFWWRCLLNGARMVKRGFDLVASAAFLTMFSPLYLLIALLVKLEDGGPVFFTQTRVGRFGREFKMYKFRSMCPNAEARLREVLARNHHKEGVTFKLKDDPRLTRVGKWLRRLSLDELPQFFNVLLGDMSIVGPRPPVPREVALYSLADRRRLAVKPGITCIWQVSGRSEIDFSGQVKLDVNYIESQSFWVDVKILAKTVPAVLSGKGAC